MTLQYLNITKGAGIWEYNSPQSPDNGFPQMDNMWTKPDRNAYTFVGGVMNKTLYNRTAYGTQLYRTSCTFDHTTNTVTSANHGLTNGMQVKLFAGGGLPTGLNETITYFIISSATNTFQLSLTSGGGAVPFTTNGTPPNYFMILGRGRGMFQYFPTQGYPNTSFIMAYFDTIDYSNGTLFAYSPGLATWYMLFNGLVPYHACFAQLGNKVYMTGELLVRKWWDDGSLAWNRKLPSVVDKSVPVAIAGAILTWNATTTVTSSVDISAVINSGSWIRRSSTSPYWDEVKSVAAGGLTITLITASSDTGVSALGGAEQASYTLPVQPSFCLAWKNKLWLANDWLGSFTNSSRIWWSVTADPENWDTTLGSGFLDVGDFTGEAITGLASLDEYLFIFKDLSYYVYQWTGDLDEPITLVKKYNYGCVSHRTIQDVGGNLIYFTGSDIRMTNGTSDQSILNGQLDKGFEYSTSTAGVSDLSSQYFSLSAVDNDYPWAVYDEVIKIYRLYYQRTQCLIYDVKNNVWIGREVDNGDSYNPGCKAYFSTTNGFALVMSPSAIPSNKLVSYEQTIMSLSEAAAAIRSKVYDFGLPNIKKKIYWVEFVFHPADGCNATLTFDYWDNGETQTGTLAGIPTYFDDANDYIQTYNLLPSVGLSSGTRKIRKRFNINQEYYAFSWVIDEVMNIGTNGWGIDSITIAYEPCVTT